MGPEIDLEDYAFDLPPDRIAQQPSAERDGARLLQLARSGNALHHARVRDLPRLLQAGDLLVRNATKVVPARLRGRKASGGAAEALLLGTVAGEASRQRALVRCSGRLRVGMKFSFTGASGDTAAELAALSEGGEVVLQFEPGVDPYAAGEMPLPPYIRRESADPSDTDRYQTTYARVPGAIAAPTAGLHLSERVLAELSRAGVEIADVVLHVGPGTFRPVQPEDIAAGHLHAETYELPEATAQAIASARGAGGRVVAVGTTSARVLETCAGDGGSVRAASGETTIFLKPGHRFQAVDGLLTNFHLPRSSLLLLVAAFAGRRRVLDAYAEAIRAGYRFYSYGDAMLIL